MIFVFSDSFIRSTKANLLSDLVSEIVQNGHFLSIPGGCSADYFFRAVNDNASTTQKELMSQFQGFSVTAQIRTYFTTVDDAHFSFETLFTMASKPAVMLMENTREWAVYKRMIDLYCGDSDFGNLFKMLYSAAFDKKAPRILPHQAGGGDMVQSLSVLRDTGYGDALNSKVFVVFDRDEKGPDKYNAKYKNLFLLLAGKDDTAISEQDIFSLNQPSFVWHMWYRRELENYFPDKVFEECGFQRNNGRPPFQDDYYANVKDYYVNRITTLSALKNSLDQLASKMTLVRFESGLRSFSLNGVGSPVSEIKLFLLKLLRVL